MLITIHRSLAILAVWMGLGISVRGDINLPTVPPPQPSPHRVEIMEGGSVEIPLSGVSRGGGQLRFLLRSQPNLGSVSEVVVTGTNKAVVRYTHDPSAGFGTDVFRYAVQGPGTGVSAPAEIEIVIRDQPPLFSAPQRVEFAEVPLGRTSLETLVIRNDGGGRIVGKLTVPEPWSLVGDGGEYVLGAGEEQEFLIQFAPTEARQYAATGEFSHAQGVMVGLGGRAFRPIEVVPNRIELRVVPGTQVRAGEAIVRNLTDDEKVLTVQSPEELVMEEVIAVPPRDEVSVALHTRSGFLGFLEDELVFADGESEFRVPVRVQSAPPKLVADLPEGASFGEIIRGESEELPVRIRNTGGTEARVKAIAGDQVQVKSESNFDTLAPGDSREYLIEVRVFDPGPFERTVRFEADSAMVEVALEGVAVVDPREAELALRRQRERANSTATAGVAPESLNAMAPPEEIRILGVTETGIEFEWDGPKEGGVREYVLYSRGFDFKPDGDVEVVWKPLKTAKVEINEKGVGRARIDGLHPGERITVAIQAVDQTGKKSRSSLPFELRSHARPQWKFPWTLVMILAIGGLVAVIVRERRRQRSAADAEFQEVARRL